MLVLKERLPNLQLLQGAGQSVEKWTNASAVDCGNI